jgi:2-isopropylmalate synthase
MAVAYIGIMDKEGKMHWGAGTNTDIIHAGADALLAAVNKMLA